MKQFNEFLTESAKKEDLRAIYKWLTDNDWKKVDMNYRPVMTVTGTKGKYTIYALIAANPDDLDRQGVKYDIFKGQKNIEDGFVKSSQELIDKIKKL